MNTLTPAVLREMMDLITEKFPPLPSIIMTNAKGMEKIRTIATIPGVTRGNDLFGIPVYVNDYLIDPMVKPLPLRGQYKTRAGFKKARNYRRWKNRIAKRNPQFYAMRDKLASRIMNTFQEFNNLEIERILGIRT